MSGSSGCGEDCTGTGLVDSLLPSLNDILSVRDCIGAVIKPVSFLTRTWFTDSGLTIAAAAPEGFAKDATVRLLPSPAMKDYSQDIRLREGGAVKQGDIILTAISKASYVVTDLDASPLGANIERFYLVGTKLYQVINVTEQLLTWKVQLRELSNQTRY